MAIVIFACAYFTFRQVADMARLYCDGVLYQTRIMPPCVRLGDKLITMYTGAYPAVAAIYQESSRCNRINWLTHRLNNFK